MNRVIRMCLIHDLGEAFTGDIPTFAKTTADETTEDALFDEWVRSFPEPQRIEWKGLLMEMRAMETAEAKLYKALDKLEAVLSHDESDISTWLPLEYDLQFHYGREQVQFSPYLRKFKTALDDMTREKIRAAGEGKEQIAVYCGAAAGDDPAFAAQARALGRWIAENGHTLVYGAGCQAVLDGGGQAIGVVPHFLATPAQIRYDLSKCYETETMAQRKETMIRLSDAFIALPGGVGTLEELSEVVSLYRLGQTKKPCFLFNINGYYDALGAVFDTMVLHGFLPEEGCHAQSKRFRQR